MTWCDGSANLRKARQGTPAREQKKTMKTFATRQTRIGVGGHRAPPKPIHERPNSGYKPLDPLLPLTGPAGTKTIERKKPSVTQIGNLERLISISNGHSCPLGDIKPHQTKPRIRNFCGCPSERGTNKTSDRNPVWQQLFTFGIIAHGSVTLRRVCAIFEDLCDRRMRHDLVRWLHEFA